MKIVFVLDDPQDELHFRLGMAQAESLQQHQVHLFTSYNADQDFPSLPKHVQLYRPFQKWNLREGLRLLPILQNLQADVIHLVQPFASKTPSFFDAHLPLAAFAELSPTTMLAISYFDLNPGHLRKSAHIKLLKLANLVFVANKSQEHLLSANPRIKATIVVQPPIPRGEKTSSLGSWRTQFFADYFYIPGAIDQHHPLVIEMLRDFLNQHPQWGVVVSGGWGHWSSLEKRNFRQRTIEENWAHQLMVPEKNNEDELHELIKHCRFFFAASLQPSSDRLSYELQLCLQHHKLPILSPLQAQMEGWEDQVNCLVLNLNDSQLQAQLDHCCQQSTTQGFVSQIKRKFEAEADPSNRISRFYSRFLESRS